MRALCLPFLVLLSAASFAQFGQDTVTYAGNWPPTHTAEGVAKKKRHGPLRPYDLPYVAYLRLHNDTLFQLGTIAYGHADIDGHLGRWEAHGDTLLLHCTAGAHEGAAKDRRGRVTDHQFRAVRGADGAVIVDDPQWAQLRLLPHPVAPPAGER